MIRSLHLAAALLCAALLAAGCGESASAYGSGSGGTSNSLANSRVIPENTGDKYAAVGSNPFVLAGKDPLSTFAADVDTASYDIFRRDVKSGGLPIPASVRLEEYVNFFKYGDTPPDANALHPFSIFTEAAPNPWAAGTLLLRIGIAGRVIPPESAEREANLVFLVDVSGSMAPWDRLPLVKKVLSEALTILKPTDRVAIVTYASTTGVKLASTPLTQKATIQAAIDSLTAGGSTAGAAGLDLAYAEAQKGWKDGGINHVLLCTDGDFNVGASSTKELLEKIIAKRKTGITLTVLGFGVGNLNDAMMEAVADAGNGVYGMIASAGQAVDYVHQRMLSTIVRIAADMKIQVEFNPSKVLAYRLLGYEDRQLTDEQFTQNWVDAGEVGSGHTVTALYEIVPIGTEIPKPKGAPPVDDSGTWDGTGIEATGEDLCLVKVRYKKPGASEQDPSLQVAQMLPAAAVKAAWSDASASLAWAGAVATLAEVLKGSPFRSKADLAVAEAALQAHAGTDADRVELLGLLAKVKLRLNH